MFDEDSIRCEYCGLIYFADVGSFHVCKNRLDASKREADDFNEIFQGNGEKIKVSIQIEIECYNSAEAVRSALDCIELNSSAKYNKNDTIKGYDDVLDCKYMMTRIVK